jgi:hypothetical protein
MLLLPKTLTREYWSDHFLAMWPVFQGLVLTLLVLLAVPVLQRRRVEQRIVGLQELLVPLLALSGKLAG